MIQFKEKQYSNQLNYDYGETDSLRQMKDSDILSQQKKTNSGLNGEVAKNALIAGAAGVGLGKLGSVVGGRVGKTASAIGKFSGKRGLVAGAVAAGLTLASQKKQRKQNEFYNDRLDYAKRQAVKRERADFRNNMTFREGYTY